MIRHFRNRDLKRCYERDDYRGIHPDWRERIRSILSLLDVAESPKDMGVAGLHLHQLKGNRAGHWSVKVKSNWRITFKFRGKDVYDVNLVDYH